MVTIYSVAWYTTVINVGIILPNKWKEINSCRRGFTIEISNQLKLTEHTLFQIL